MHIHPSSSMACSRAFLLLAMVSFLNASGIAATFEVTTTADSGPGSLRQALEYANANQSSDTITFSNGSNGTVDFHDNLAETITLAGTELLAYAHMTIIGPGADKLSISGNSLSRVFQMAGSGPTIVISGIKVMNGRTSTQIGYDNGGGILLFGGSLTLIDCVLSGNTANWSGGGIYVTYGGKLTLIRCSVSGNTAKFGGGIYMWSNDVSDSFTLDLIQCTVSGNSATYGDGGGISAFGGGMARGNKFTMFQSTASGNTAQGTAGGIFTGGALVNVTQSTVHGNTGRGQKPGGAAANFPLAGGIYASRCTLNLENSIMAKNTGPDFFQSSVILNQIGKSIVGDGSIAAGPDLMVADPLLGPLQNNGGLTFTHGLLPGSPAINAVDNSPVPTDTFDVDGDLDTTEPLPFDQRGSGFPRASGILDIGAFELPKSVTINAETASREEGTGAGKTPFTFTISRVVSTEGDVTIDYAVTGVEVNGGDFDGSLPSGSVTIPDGRSSTTLTIEVAKDTAPETDETFTVTLANPANGYAILGQGATSTIKDDDTVSISIAAADANADENTTDSGIWRISRTGPLAGSTTVRLAIDASSTAMPSDWTQQGASFSSLAPGSTGSASIPAGETFLDITLTPSGDIHAEAAETVKLIVVADASYTITGIANSTVTIAANDFVVINTSNAGEGSLRQAMLNSNNLVGAETITFEGSVFTDAAVPDIIDLASRLPTFGGQTTVAGPGSDELIIRRPAAAARFGLMQSFPSSDVTLSGLTLSGGIGGIANQGSLRVDRCTISGNSDSIYGGILNNGTLVVTHSTISGNTSTGGVGGGIYNLGKRTLSVFNSTISGNSSKNGGAGISIVSGSTVWIANSTVSGNTAGSSGAGILNLGALTVVNSTVTGNRGTGQGGGIATLIGSSLTLANSIVAGNTASSGTDINTFSSSNLISSNGANFIGNSTGAAGATATDKTFASTRTTLSQLLAPLADNGGPTLTHALVNGSPAINAGANAGIPIDIIDLDGDLNTTEPIPYDQRGGGFVRMIGATVDIGAFEAFAFEPGLTAATTDEDVMSSAGLVITANPADDGLTTHYQIANILNGTLYRNDGITVIASGDFITKAQGAAGLRFLPGANLHSGNTASFGFTAQAAVTSTNGGLRGVAQAVAITVHSVNDAPTIVAPGLVDQTMEVASGLTVPLPLHFADLDGDVLGFSVLANSNSTSASATIHGTDVVLDGLDNGVTNITILADDGLGGTISDTFMVSVGTAEPTPLQIGTTATLIRQNGLFEIIVHVTNTTPLPINGFRLHVDFRAYLAAYPSLRLYNATSPAGTTDVYVDYPYPVPLDGVVPLKLSYYTSTRTFPSPFNPLLTVETLASSQLPGTDGSGVQPQLVTLPDRTILLEFPSIAGRWYRVRYSSDLENWSDSPVPIQASTNRMQWIDNGPPFTDISPVATNRRYYRVNEIFAP